MSLKCELLCSICMFIYFSIIDIRKYMIKRLYITSVTQVHDLLSAMTIITKAKAREARY